MEIPPLLNRSLLVLSASVTGTAVDIAERIGRTGRRNGWSVAVKSVDEFDRVSSSSRSHRSSAMQESFKLKPEQDLTDEGGESLTNWI